jgi:hypothetical protein
MANATDGTLATEYVQATPEQYMTSIGKAIGLSIILQVRLLCDPATLRQIAGTGGSLLTSGLVDS